MEYYKKLENYTGPPSDYHGTEGPIQTTPPLFVDEVRGHRESRQGGRKMDCVWVRRGGGLETVAGQSCEGVLLQGEKIVFWEAVAETSEMLSWLGRLLTLRLAPFLGCCLVL